MSQPVRLLLLLALLLGVQLVAAGAFAHAPAHSGCPEAAMSTPAAPFAVRSSPPVRRATVASQPRASFEVRRPAATLSAAALPADAALAASLDEDFPAGAMDDCCSALGCGTTCHALAPVDAAAMRLPIRLGRASAATRPDPAAPAPEVALPPPRQRA